MNDQPDIAQATRERIHAAARRMGYLPNAAARALKTNRTYNLGVLFVDEKQSGLTHEYFSAVLDSFKVEAEKRGYDITFINHNISGRSMSYLEHCHYRGVDGVVIACVNFYDPQVVELVNGDVPVVVSANDPVENGVYSGLKQVTYTVYNGTVYNEEDVTQRGVLYSWDAKSPPASPRRKCALLWMQRRTTATMSTSC